jgi:hypothetical protein
METIFLCLVVIIVLVSIFCLLSNPGKFIMNNQIEYKQLSDKELEQFELE